MPNSDIFGYDRTVESNTLVTSEYAVLKFGDSDINLVQQCNVQYQHRVTPKYESGSSNLFWQTGQAQGNLTFSKLLGDQGFMAGFDFKVPCGEGELLGLDVSLGGDDSPDCVKVSGSKSLAFSDAMPQAYTLSWNVGSLDVVEGGTVLLSKMSKGDGG